MPRWTTFSLVQCTNIYTISPMQNIIILCHTNFFPQPHTHILAIHLFHCFQIVWFLFDKLTMNQIWQEVKLLSADCFTVVYVWHDTTQRWTLSFQHNASGHCRKVNLEHRFTLEYDFAVQNWIWYTALRLGNWKLLKTARWKLEAQL